jgi:hypothetical protein
VLLKLARCGAKLRVQAVQHPGQAAGIELWVHFGAAGGVFGVQVQGVDELRA